ncbi:hypothetical protein, partial [Xylella fastidiosa]
QKMSAPNANHKLQKTGEFIYYHDFKEGRTPTHINTFSSKPPKFVRYTQTPTAIGMHIKNQFRHISNSCQYH